jgi:hypothetical protein
MRSIVKTGQIFAVLVLVAIGSFAPAGATPADDHRQMVIVFKDGHRLDLASVARIDFKSPIVIVFKDGHQQNVPAADIAHIEFESSSIPSRNHFVGKWEVGEGNGSNFYITLEADGVARKSIGSHHGTWVLVDGEARISWDDGWHDAIRKVGAKHEKLAFEPGKSFDDTPSNITAARTTEPRPI